MMLKFQTRCVCAEKRKPFQENDGRGGISGHPAFWCPAVKDGFSNFHGRAFLFSRRQWSSGGQHLEQRARSFTARDTTFWNSAPRPAKKIEM
jgi:hypothetical protein